MHHQALCALGNRLVGILRGRLCSCGANEGRLPWFGCRSTERTRRSPDLGRRRLRSLIGLGRHRPGLLFSHSQQPRAQPMTTSARGQAATLAPIVVIAGTWSQVLADARPFKITRLR